MIKFDKAIRIIVGWMVLVMAAVVIIQVFFRYVLNASLIWSEEFARYLMIWMTFLGATSALFHGELASLNVIKEKASGSFKVFLNISSGVLLLLFQGIMLYMGFKFMMGNINQTSPSMGISMLIPNAAIPTSALIMIVYTVRNYFLDAEIVKMEGE